MKNIYLFRDMASLSPIFIAFANTDAEVARNCCPMVIGNKPGQVPFQDVELTQIGSMSDDGTSFDSLSSPRLISILDAYHFSKENKMEKVDNTSSKVEENKE